jgi:hypothetical protein
MPRTAAILLPLLLLVALAAAIGRPAQAQTASIDEAPLIAASLAQCTRDLPDWIKTFDEKKLVHDGKPASAALQCREERLDRNTLSERVRWYAFDPQAARADWAQVRENFGLKTFIEAIGGKIAEADGNIPLSPEDMDVANIMLSESSSLQALLDQLK